MSNHDPERAFVAARVAQLDHQLDRAAAEMTSALDLYRDDLTGQYAELEQSHRGRMDALRAETDQYIKSLTGEADEPSPGLDVGRGRDGVSPTGWSSPAGPGGPGPGRPINPHAAELEEAERLYALSMAEYAIERQRLIRANPGMF
jgi:hypothetical protein